MFKERAFFYFSRSLFPAIYRRLLNILQEFRFITEKQNISETFNKVNKLKLTKLVRFYQDV